MILRYRFLGYARNDRHSVYGIIELILIIIENKYMTQQNQIQIKATDETLRGMYSNATQVLHTKEEFVLDFLNVFPPTGTLNARVIVSPGHLKRMIQTLQENLKKYEDSFGVVASSEAPATTIGFEVRN